MSDFMKYSIWPENTKHLHRPMPHSHSFWGMFIVADWHSWWLLIAQKFDAFGRRYYWADVPVTPRTEAHVIATPPNATRAFFSGEPHVKYRGIFINDESPALDGWVTERFGSFNSMFYSLVRFKVTYLLFTLVKCFLENVKKFYYRILWRIAHKEPQPLQRRWVGSAGRVGLGEICVV